MKLILTDIDGTILPWRATQVSARTRAAFHAALDAGDVVGVSSGRGIDWIPPFFGGDEACVATAIATNGMQIYHDGVCVCEKHLPHGSLERVAELLADWPGAGLLCFEGATPRLVVGDVADLASIFPGYAETCVPAKGVPDVPVVKANLFVSGGAERHRALVDEVNREVGELHLDLARTGFSNIMLAGWDKGAAVVYLRDLLGIRPGDVFVFGDANNDLPMFRVTENSVAVANATEEASRAARWHIGPVEEDSVAAAIEALAAGEFPFTRGADA